MRKLFVLFSVLLFLSLIGLHNGLFLQKASAVLGLQAGGVSIAPHEDPSTPPPYRSWFMYNVRPGDVIREKMDVTNLNDRELDLVVDGVDATITDDGNFALQDYNKPKKFVGKWVNIESTEITLAAKSERVVDFTITIPSDAEEGDYWGGVTVIEQFKFTGSGAELKQYYRVGARIVLRVNKQTKTGLFTDYPNFDPEKVKGLDYIAPSERPSSVENANEYLTASIVDQKNEEKTERSWVWLIVLIVVMSAIALCIPKKMKKKIGLGVFVFTFLSTWTIQAVNAEGLSIGPSAEYKGEKTSRSWFIYKVKPGELIEDSIRVVNLDNKPAVGVLRAVDGQTTDGGGFALGQDDILQKNVGSWITLEKNELELKTLEEVFVKFTMKIPVQIEPGDYAGGIVVFAKEMVKGPADEKGFNIITRVGARIYVTVEGQKIVSAEFGQPQFDWINGEAQFSLHIKNTGNSRIRPIVTVTISSKLSGNVVETLHLPDALDFAPGSEANIPLKWENPKLGWFNAAFKIQYLEKTDEFSLGFQTFSNGELAIVIGGGLIVFALIFFLIRFIKNHLRFA